MTDPIVPEVLADSPTGSVAIDKKWMERSFTHYPKFTIEDAAWHHQTNEASISRWCLETYGKTFQELKRLFKSELVRAIHIKQSDMALSGNVPMLIHLGKHYLGQKDDILPVIEHKPIPLAYVPMSKRIKNDNS